MSRIGRAIIEVLLKSEQAKAEAKNIKQEIAEIGNQPGTPSPFDAFKADLKATGDRIAQMKAETQGATSALSGFAEAGAGIGLALAGITAFIVGAHEINELLEEGNRRAVAFRNALTTGAEPGQERIRAIQDEIDGVSELERAKARLTKQEQEDEQALRENAKKANGGELSFKQQAQVGDQIKQMRADNAKAIDALDELYSKRSLQRAEERLARTLAANKEGIERTYAEQKIIDDKLDADARKANSPEEADRIAQTKRAIDAEFDARREKIRIEEADRMREAEARKGEADAREERRQKEMAERIAQHAAAAFARETERALKDLYTGIERASAAQSSATTQALAGVTADVSRIASLIDLRLLANPIDRR